MRWSIVDNMIEHTIGLLELEGKLSVWRGCIVWKHDSSLTLACDIFHQWRKRGRA